MKYIEPHIHMVTRTTDDYQHMAEAGVCGGDGAGILGGLSRVPSPR